MLPPHCTHCLQLFDVWIASPFKSHIKWNLGESYKNTFLMFQRSVCEIKISKECQIYQQKLTADLLRYIIVLCFIDALRAPTTKKIAFLHFENMVCFNWTKMSHCLLIIQYPVLQKACKIVYGRLIMVFKVLSQITSFFKIYRSI